MINEKRGDTVMHKKLIPCGTKEALLVVADYQNGIMKGVMRHPRLDNPMPVSSLEQFILAFDSLLDLEGCPDRPLPLVRSIPEEDSAMAVFQIQVLFREHSTWQGRLVWKDKEQEASFRSVLELMQLLDEILGN